MVTVSGQVRHGYKVDTKMAATSVNKIVVLQAPNLGSHLLDATSRHYVQAQPASQQIWEFCSSSNQLSRVIASPH
jgi:hypothetical protein